MVCQENFCPACIIAPLAIAGGASTAGGAASKKKMWIWIGISILSTVVFMWIYLKFIKKVY